MDANEREFLRSYKIREFILRMTLEITITF
jgi:hypothetical protein